MDSFIISELFSLFHNKNPKLEGFFWFFSPVRARALAKCRFSATIKKGPA